MSALSNVTRGSKNETVPSADSCAEISEDAICPVITREQGHHDRYACLCSPYQELKLELRLRFQFRQHAQCQTSGA